MTQPVMRGVVVSIHVAPNAEGRMLTVKEAHAMPGRGLEGDRYFNGTGTYSKDGASGRDLTLIELEAVEALGREAKLELAPGDARRNVVVRGMALNHLVGREFRVGDVRLRGIRLCEPCHHLDDLVRQSVSPTLLHRGGLRANIISEGTIRVDDVVETV